MAICPDVLSRRCSLIDTEGFRKDPSKRESSILKTPQAPLVDQPRRSHTIRQLSATKLRVDSLHRRNSLLRPAPEDIVQYISRCRYLHCRSYGSVGIFICLVYADLALGRDWL